MDMGDYLPFAMFGVWVVLAGILMLVGRRALRRAVRERMVLYGRAHEWREASSLEYARLKLAFYDDCQADLEAAGFKVLGDIEDVTLAETRENPHTFRRVMASRDRSTVAEFWQVNFTPWKQLFRMAAKGLGDGRFCRIYSEAEDGRVFGVERSPVKCREIEPDGVTIRYADGKAGADELWTRFVGDFEEYKKEHTDFTARGFKFLDEVIASEKRQQEKRVALRRRIGLVTREELLREGMPEKAVDGYVKAFARQAKKIEAEDAVGRQPEQAPE